MSKAPMSKSVKKIIQAGEGQELCSIARNGGGTIAANGKKYRIRRISENNNNPMSKTHRYTKYRIEFENWFGDWEEFDTYSSKEEAEKEFGSNPNERLIEVQEYKLKDTSD